MASIFQNGVWCNGFDFFGTGANAFVAGGVWDGVGANITTSPIYARFPGGKGVQMSGATTVNRSFGVNLATVVVGFAYLVTANISSGAQGICSFNDTVGANFQCGLCLNANGSLQFYKTNPWSNSSQPSNPVGPATVAGLIIPNAYGYLETLVTIGATGGATVRYNGATVLSFVGNTQVTANAFTNQLVLGPGAGTNVLPQFDDVYMLDTTGVAPLNTFLGDVRIRTFAPAGDSATVGLNAFTTSPVQGTGQHFNNVKEIPADDGTTINLDGTIGDRESYRFPGLTGVAPYFLNTWVRFQKDDANSRSCAITNRNGTTDVVGATIASPASYTHFNLASTTDPNTGQPWTTTGFGTGTLSNFEAGLKVIA